MAHATDSSDGLSARPSLRRGIGAAGFFSLAFGSMIGVGWVTAMGGWLEQAGPLGAIIAFALGGALMILIGLCYAELTSMMPVAGGEVAYAYRASGTGKAFLVGWFLVFGYLSVSAFEAISIGIVLSYLLPWLEVWPLWEIGGSAVYGPHLVLGVGFTGLITMVNYVGVRWAAILQTALTLAFLAACVAFVTAGNVRGTPEHLPPLFAQTGAVAGIASVFVTVPFWFVGFDTIPQGAEEATTAVAPRRLATLIIVSIAGATLFYLVLIYTVGVTGPWTELTGKKLPTAEAFARTFESRWLVNLVLVAALLGLLTSWNGFFLAASRVLFALGRGRIVPGSLGHTHPRYGTPSNAVLFCGVVTLAGAFMGRGALIPFVNVGSLCIVVAFLGVSYSALRLRRTAPDAARPYRMPAGRAVGGAALLGACCVLGFMVVPGSPAALSWPLEWLILATFVLGGAVAWHVGRPLRAATSETQRAALILGDE